MHMQQIFSDLKHLFLVILAGGEGRRLFPLSSEARPKQFCDLDAENTFIQATLKRFTGLGISPEQVVVITTNHRQTELANEQLNDLGVPAQNVLEIEPVFEYAGAMVKAAEFVRDMDEDAVIVNTPADQFVVVDDEFRETVARAVMSAQAGFPTIVGVKVADLNTIMGCGHAKFCSSEAGSAKTVLGFVEKPKSKAVAEKLMRSDASVCNTGINVWRAADVIAASVGLDLAAGVPTEALMERLSGAGESSATQGFGKRLKVAFGSFPWFDCGTLKSLHDISAKTPGDNNAMLGEGEVRSHNCRGSLFVAARGVELHVSGIEDAAVVVNKIGERVITSIVWLNESQRVGEVADEYYKRDDLLGKDFSINARNNHVTQTALSSRVTSVFIGVDWHVVTPIELASGNIMISVSNDGAPKEAV